MRALSLLLLPTCCLVVFGQSPREKSASSRAKPLVDATAQLQPSIVHQTALAIVNSTVDELPAVDDLQVRIELTATVIRLLSKSEPERCRKALDSLFAKTMELKTSKSKGGRQEYLASELDSEQLTGSAIGRVIQIAAILDRKLTESYIRKFREALDSEAETQSGEKQSQIGLIDLKIGIELIATDPKLAIVAARRSLRSGVVPQTLLFLALLRKKDGGLARDFFLDALRSTQFRRGRDVNELLLLFAFAFSAVNVPVISTEGLAVYSIPGYSGSSFNYPVDDFVVKEFLRSSAMMLLDSGRYLPDTVGGSSIRPLADYYFLSLIEPRTSEYLPSVTQRISDQRNILLSFLQTEERTGAVSALERWHRASSEANSPAGSTNSTVESLLSRAEHTANVKIRDQLYFRAALAALVDDQEEQALELASKLSLEYSQQASELLRFRLAARKVERAKFDEAEDLARRDSVAVRRCYILTKIASSLLEDGAKNHSRAVGLLDEVMQLAQGLRNQKQQLAVLTGAATVFARFDTARAFELLRDVVKSAMRLEGFKGNLSIDQSLDVGGFLFDFSVYDQEFGYFDLLKKLGAKDFFTTIQNVQVIEKRTLRVKSALVVCDSALASN